MLLVLLLTMSQGQIIHVGVRQERWREWFVTVRGVGGGRSSCDKPRKAPALCFFMYQPLKCRCPLRELLVIQKLDRERLELEFILLYVLARPKNT